MRGNGVGSEIFKEFEIHMKVDGIKKIIFFTSKGDSTEHFYHKQGLESYNGLTFMGKQL